MTDKLILQFKKFIEEPRNEKREFSKLEKKYVEKSETLGVLLCSMVK